MRTGLIFAPLILIASPAAAQPVPVQVDRVERVLADPATTDRLMDMVQGLSSAMLSMPVGDIEAAAKGRKPTPADHVRTVGSETGVTPQELNARIDAARPKIANSIDALARAIPAMTRSLAEIERVVDRAAANMPDPNYPRR